MDDKAEAANDNEMDIEAQSLLDRFRGAAAAFLE